MCLAVPAKVVERKADAAIVELGGNRLNVSMVLTPDAIVGEWVLVHAGFAISTIGETEALDTWKYLRACYEGDLSALEDEAGGRVLQASGSNGDAVE